MHLHVPSKVTCRNHRAPWVPVPPPSYGGTELVLDVLARGLVKAGHDVVLFTTGDATCDVPRQWLFEHCDPDRMGATGWAECTPLGSAYLPAYAGGVRAGLKELAPKLIGLDPRELGIINRRMDEALRGHPYVKSPIDIACWDILGKTCGLPVVTLLGGRQMEDIQLYRAVSQEAPDAMARKVIGYRSEGYRKFQLKTGGAADDDIARIKACVPCSRPAMS